MRRSMAPYWSGMAAPETRVTNQGMARDARVQAKEQPEFGQQDVLVHRHHHGHHQKRRPKRALMRSERGKAGVNALQHGHQKREADEAQFGEIREEEVMGLRSHVAVTG